MNDINFSDHLEYKDGLLFWKTRKQGRPLSKIAGSVGAGGYLKVNFFGRNYLSHRIIYEMHKGKIPTGMFVDHIDRNRKNNKIENLRLATKKENNRNNSAIGFSFVKDKKQIKKPWQARIRFENKLNHLGYYETIVDARAAYLRARKQLFGEFS